MKGAVAAQCRKQIVAGEMQALRHVILLILCRDLPACTPYDVSYPHLFNSRVQANGSRRFRGLAY